MKNKKQKNLHEQLRVRGMKISDRVIECRKKLKKTLQKYDCCLVVLDQDIRVSDNQEVSALNLED